MTVKVVAVRGGTDFLIDVGIGSEVGQENVPLGRVFSGGRLSPGPALPIQSILARGYWADLAEVDEETLADVRERVAALL